MEYEEPAPPEGASPPSPYDATDAIYAAARDLCANGARDGTDFATAVFAYNHSESYVAEVLDLAQTNGATPVETVATSTAGGIAVDWTLAQVGTPYVWGAETPGVGFDCTGPIQVAYKIAGIDLPRVAQDQFDARPMLPRGEPPEPGDLAFFGGGPGDVGHVGLYLGVQAGQAVMVEPHTPHRCRSPGRALPGHRWSLLGRWGHLRRVPPGPADERTTGANRANPYWADMSTDRDFTLGRLVTERRRSRSRHRIDGNAEMRVALLVRK